MEIHVQTLIINILIMKKYILITILFLNIMLANFQVYSGYEPNQMMKIEGEGKYNMIGSYIFAIQNMHTFNQHEFGYGVEYLSKTKDKSSENFKISFYDIFFKWNYNFNDKFGGFIKVGGFNSIDCDILGYEVETSQDISYGFGIIYNKTMQFSVNISSLLIDEIPNFIFNKDLIDIKLLRVNLTYLF